MQPVREDAALQLAQAMAESQKGYSRQQDNPTADQASGKESTKGLKKAELALRKCSPLTVSLLQFPSLCVAQTPLMTEDTSIENDVEVYLSAPFYMDCILHDR